MTPKQEAALRLAADAIDEFCELGAIIRPLEVRDAIREALAEPKEKYQYGTPLLDAMTGKSEQPVNVAAVNTSSERVAKQAQNVHEQPAQQEPQRWAVFCQGCRKEWSVSYPHPGKSICADCDDKLAQYDASPQPAQQQEPVAWMNPYGGLVYKRITGHEKNNFTIPLYTSLPKNKPCEWQREDDIHMPDTWRSECGVLWTFTDGGPVENDMKHCCGCGAKLKEKNT